MKFRTYLWVAITQTLLRMLPFPTRTGLVRIGNPGRDAPVLLTCNFRLTVERVKRALEGLDVYLLVANSRGINVWCAATGGLLTDHDVISVLKTSGIDALVDHRRVILPQLAATGVQGKHVSEQTGWRVIWGPIRVSDVPRFLSDRRRATRGMRTVTFPWQQRLEMAVSWAFPLSVLPLVLLPCWPAAVLPLGGLVWAASFLIVMSFPLYEGLLHSKGKGVGFVFFDFGRRGLPRMACAAVMVGGLAFMLAPGDLSGGRSLGWGLASFVVLLILGLDLTGSTPTYKSGLHEDRLLAIAVDPELCTGAAFCERVCPKEVFEIDRSQRLAILERPDE